MLYIKKEMKATIWNNSFLFAQKTVCLLQHDFVASDTLVTAHVLQEKNM